MNEIDFTLDGTRYQLSRDQVILAMRKQTPGRIQTYAAEIEGVRYPVKQVLASALQVPVTSFVSTRAQDLLQKLDFVVVNVDHQGDPAATLEGAPSTKRVTLELAIQFASVRSDVDAAGVVDAAERFAAFLDR